VTTRSAACTRAGRCAILADVAAFTGQRTATVLTGGNASLQELSRWTGRAASEVRACAPSLCNGLLAGRGACPLHGRVGIDFAHLQQYLDRARPRQAEREIILHAVDAAILNSSRLQERSSDVVQGNLSSRQRKERVMGTTTNDEVGSIIAAFAAQVGDRHRSLALIARFRVRKGAGPRIEKAFAEAALQTAREAGVFAYQLHREPDNSDAFVVYERWRSLQDLEAHLRMPYIAALRAEIDTVMEGQPSFQVMLPA